jgi:hypothetical protein
MPYSITTKDGITLQNIPDDIAADSPQLKQRVAQIRMQMQAQQPKEVEPEPPPNPTDDMSMWERVRAGIGKGLTDTYRGLEQASAELGSRGLLPSTVFNPGYAALQKQAAPIVQAEIDEAKRLDKPLVNTASGSAGNVVGRIAGALPSMLVPGANTMAGAGVIGAAQGALDSVASDDSRLTNTLVGGAAGAGGVGVARLLKAGYQGAKGLLEPFTSAGRDRIAGRVLTEFAADPKAAAAAARSAPARTATGAAPLVDEATKDVGLAQLRRAMVSADPQVASDVAAREMSNNASRLSVLQDLAGDAGKREFFDASRQQAAQELYSKAYATKIDPSKLSPAVKGEMTKLMRRPSIQEAMKAAKELAAEQGVKIDKNATGSIQGLHYMKMALDDMIAGAPQRGLGNEKTRALVGSRDKLVNLIETLAPDYAEARATYAAMSKPLNQMDVGQRLLEKATSATTDLQGNPRVMANSLARQLRDEEALVKQAGLRGRQSLEDVLEPDQLASLRAVLDEMNTRAAVQEAGKVSGSPTAQYLAGQNVLRRIIGPTGMPQSWSEGILQSSVGDALSSTLGAGYRLTGAAPRLQTRIAESLLDPQTAAGLMEQAIRQQAAPQLQTSVARKLLERSTKSLPSTLAITQDQ